ncbi:unnamed protein product [Caenorhabditis angaria]|uniref:Da-p36 protein n=1 Tax=Caenorhabditis angaria TaxID=860376 RepID=A0A9P1MUT3_9PELO|nr:unnamed protein product [Caenorhabditis angaria]
MIRFILTFCLFSILVDATDVTVQEQMICNHHPDWKYWTRYVEYDYGKPNEELLRTEWEYLNENSHGPRRVRQFSISGDDGWFDTAYEIGVEIFHTCTDTGETARLNVPLGDVQIDSKLKDFKLTGFVLNSQCIYSNCDLIPVIYLPGGKYT